MSVSVSNLTKYYGDQAALKGISFEVQKGEILGFLGPNGAGKTTTMKILTGFLPQSEGFASVNGFDVQKNSLESRRSVGYLPEGNPLYREMYIREYLHFIGSVYKLKNITARVNDVIERTGLGPESKKLIGQLSKGYRQRVGLAQAIIHDPAVLILDEPTSGLDPNQLVGIRQLVKELGREKTIIFSTHIMQEVQAICDRVVIINKGIIIADDPIEELKSRSTGAQVVFIELNNTLDLDVFKKIKGLKKVEMAGNNSYRFYAEPKKDIRADIIAIIAQEKYTLLEMRTEQSSVEEIFQQLTQTSKSDSK